MDRKTANARINSILNNKLVEQGFWVMVFFHLPNIARTDKPPPKSCVAVAGFFSSINSRAEVIIYGKMGKISLRNS